MYGFVHKSWIAHASFGLDIAGTQAANIRHWGDEVGIMLLMAFGAGRAQPLLQCSVCGLAVALACEGTIVYPREMTAGTVRRVLLAHTRHCLPMAQAQFPDDGGPCLMPLAAYLAHFDSHSLPDRAFAASRQGQDGDFLTS
jgi:hypothetical protein